MPRLVNKLPAYSLHKSSGNAKVKYQGKVKYLGKYGTPESKTAYAEFLATLPKSSETKPAVEIVAGVVALVGEVALKYEAHALAYYVRDGVPTGEHVTIHAALVPLVNRCRYLPVSQFGPKRLKEVREDMIALGWARSTINKSVNRVKLCFGWAASEELIPAEIALGLKTVSGLKKNRTAARETAPIGPVDDETVNATLPKVSEFVVDVIRVMRFTGMRPGEALAMRGEEIDRTDPTLWVYRPGHHKTEHHGLGRTVFLGPNATEIVRRYLLKAGDGERLFPIGRNGLRRSIMRGCRRAFPHPTLSSIPPKKRTDEQKADLEAWHKAHCWHPNQLRHSVGTEVRAKYGLEAAQVLLGHSRADVTQTYAERDMAKAREVARKIG